MNGPEVAERRISLDLIFATNWYLSAFFLGSFVLQVSSKVLVRPFFLRIRLLTQPFFLMMRLSTLQSFDAQAVPRAAESPVKMLSKSSGVNMEIRRDTPHDDSYGINGCHFLDASGVNMIGELARTQTCPQRDRSVPRVCPASKKHPTTLSAGALRC